MRTPLGTASGVVIGSIGHVSAATYALTVSTVESFPGHDPNHATAVIGAIVFTPNGQGSSGLRCDLPFAGLPEPPGRVLVLSFG